MKQIVYKANNGRLVKFDPETIVFSEYLNMLYRHHLHKDRPITTDLEEFDLVLSEVICRYRVIPCPSRREFKPRGFENFQNFADFMGFADFETDWNNEYISAFLDLLGFEKDPGDDHINPYECWTLDEIRQQKEEDAILEMQVDEDDADDIEDYW